MIERGERLDAVGQQFVKKPVIEIEALRIGRACSLRKNARPRDREAIGLGPQRLHQLDIVLVPVKVVVSDVAGAAIGNFAWRVREAIPDRRAATVFANGAFDLIGRGRRAPSEIGREGGRGILTAGSGLRIRRFDRSRRQPKRRPSCDLA
jgi:hypothetical protein